MSNDKKLIKIPNEKRGGQTFVKPETVPKPSTPPPAQNPPKKD